jgi:hypothetical protein
VLRYKVKQTWSVPMSTSRKFPLQSEANRKNRLNIAAVLRGMFDDHALHLPQDSL